MSNIIHVTTDFGIENSHDLTTVAKGTRSILNIEGNSGAEGPPFQEQLYPVD